MAVSITQTANPSGANTSSNVATYSSVAIGAAAANRIVVVLVGSELASASINSVTLGGNAMSAGTQGNFGAVYARAFYLAYPTGTTANIVVTYGAGATSTQNHIAVYSVTGGVYSSTGADQSTDMDTTDRLTTGAITIASGGGFIAIAAGATDTVAKTWAEATEDLDVDAGGFRFTTATRTTALTATAVTCTGGTNGENGALSYLLFTENVSPTVALNSPADTATITDTTPDLVFTGTDTESDAVRYQVHIDTVNTFDSQGSAFALIAQTSAAGNTNSVTTSSIDTTGANLIILGVSYNTGATPTITDSEGNTWTALTAHALGSNGTSRIYYCYNPTVGSGHTFSNTGSSNYSVVSAQAFSGALSTPFDQENGSTNPASSTLSPGSVTPSVDNEVVISHFMFSVAGTASVNGGFSTPTQADFSGGNNYGGAMAYLVQTTATAANPQWTSGGGATGLAGSNATFKAGGGPLIDAVSGTDSGFLDVTDGADTDPFDSGDQLSFTVQGGDALSDDTYYWRVRAKDPSGTNTYGAWATTRSFTLTTSGARRRLYIVT